MKQLLWIACHLKRSWAWRTEDSRNDQIPIYLNPTLFMDGKNTLQYTAKQIVAALVT